LNGLHQLILLFFFHIACLLLRSVGLVGTGGVLRTSPSPALPGNSSDTSPESTTTSVTGIEKADAVADESTENETPVIPEATMESDRSEAMENGSSNTSSNYSVVSVTQSASAVHDGAESTSLSPTSVASLKKTIEATNATVANSSAPAKKETKPAATTTVTSTTTPTTVVAVVETKAPGSTTTSAVAAAVRGSTTAENASQDTGIC
jgi:hypothetical protein